MLRFCKCGIYIGKSIHSLCMGCKKFYLPYLSSIVMVLRLFVFYLLSSGPDSEICTVMCPTAIIVPFFLIQFSLDF